MHSSIVSALRSAERVVITTHTRPDGDAIGSQLALGNFLLAKGKEVLMVNQDPSPYNLEWLPGADLIQIYDASLAQVAFIARADVVVILDTSTKERLGSPAAQLRGSDGIKILFDHHTDPESWFDLMWRRESASSTGELLFEMMEIWDVETIDYDIAAPLYTAIVTDTGSFRFSNVTPRLHRIVAELLERGHLEPSTIYSEVYDKKSFEGLSLMSCVLSTIALHYDGRVGSMVVSRRFLKDTGAPVEETEGFVNHLLSIEGVSVALIFTETERGTKVSFRSKDDFHVHKWAQYFGGGGHRNAAGAFIREPLEDAIKKTVRAAPKFVELSELEKPDDLSDEDAAYLTSLMNTQNK